MKNVNSLLEVSLFRNMSGKLELVAEADSAIENLMKTLSAEETTDCFSYGRMWQSKGRPSKTKSGLDIYVIPAKNDLVRAAQDKGYDLWSPGEAMHTQNRTRSGRLALTNLSFLRVVGISKGPVTFTSDEMLTRGAVDLIGRQISQAVRSFFDDHLREHTVNISVLLEA